MLTGLPKRFSDDWLSVRECAEFFGCSLETMKKRLRAGAIPSRLFWRKRYVHRVDLLQFLNAGEPARPRRMRRVRR